MIFNSFEQMHYQKVKLKELRFCHWLNVNIYWLQNIFYVNYIFLSKTFLGTCIDHHEFNVYPAIIGLFLKTIKSFQGSFPKRRKNILKISLKLKSR